MRTLIVEYETGREISSESFLRRYGFCDTVWTGEKTIRAYSASLQSPLPYDLICLDLTTPGLNGPDVLRQIRVMGLLSGNETKVIVTNLFSELYHGDALRNLWDDHLFKPFKKPTLLAALYRTGLLDNAIRFAMTMYYGAQD